MNFARDANFGFGFDEELIAMQTFARKSLAT